MYIITVKKKRLFHQHLGCRVEHFNFGRGLNNLGKSWGGYFGGDRCLCVTCKFDFIQPRNSVTKSGGSCIAKHSKFNISCCYKHKVLLNSMTSKDLSCLVVKLNTILNTFIEQFIYDLDCTI